MAPWALRRRAGTSGGGGGGRGGSSSSSSSSSGSKSGSSSSGSSGKSPSSGSGSGSASSGGGSSGSSKPPSSGSSSGSVKPGGSSGSSSASSGRAPGGGAFTGVKSGSNTSPANAQNVGTGGPRTTIFGSAPRSSPYPYGYGRPYVRHLSCDSPLIIQSGGLLPVYGFWPIYWQRDSYNDTENDQGDTRPGGPLTALALTAGGDASSIYTLYGDLESVQAVSDVTTSCSLANATTTPDLANNQTLARYRSDSFELLYFGSSPNGSVVSCINDTLVNELPIIGDSSSAASLSISLVVASLVALNLFRALRF